MTSSLADDLGFGLLPQDEFEIVLHGYFGRGQLLKRRSTHERDGVVALEVAYDRRGLAIGVNRGPALTPADVSEVGTRVRAESSNDRRRIRRDWAFATLPVRRGVRYRDCFQVVPVGVAAPTAQFLNADHPFVLEASFCDSEDPRLLQHRSMRALREAELLLGSLLRAGVRRELHGSRWAWVFEEGDDGALTTRHCMLGYRSDDRSLIVDEFTHIETLVDPVDPHEYYNATSRRAGETFCIPATFEQQLDQFFGLPHLEAQRFLRAAYWLQHADQISERSLSASYVAVIQAVETLMGSESTAASDPCPTCSRDRSPGPSAQFRNFVERFAPGVSPSDRSDMYRVRSKLTHGEHLLLEDIDNGWSSVMSPRMFEELNDTERARRVARVALVNWLNARAVEPDRG